MGSLDRSSTTPSASTLPSGISSPSSSCESKEILCVGTTLTTFIVLVHFAQQLLSSSLLVLQFARSLVFQPTLSLVRFDLSRFILIADIQYEGNPHLATAGGALGILASCGAYYGALSLFWTQQTTVSFIRLPPLIVAPSNV